VTFGKLNERSAVGREENSIDALEVPVFCGDSDLVQFLALCKGSTAVGRQIFGKRHCLENCALEKRQFTELRQIFRKCDGRKF